jgi:hypothetical protein
MLADEAGRPDPQQSLEVSVVVSRMNLRLVWYMCPPSERRPAWACGRRREFTLRSLNHRRHGWQSQYGGKVENKQLARCTSRNRLAPWHTSGEPWHADGPVACLPLRLLPNNARSPDTQVDVWVYTSPRVQSRPEA